MIETAIAQLRFGTSMAFGARFHLRSLDRILEAMYETKREFGSLGDEASELLSAPRLDDSTRAEVQLRRFRKQAHRASETAFYAPVLQEIGIDPRSLDFHDIAVIPLTRKAALRSRPDAFVPRSARPALRATTTGTTGRPASVYFSEHELASIAALTALTFANQSQVDAADVVQISMNPRAQLVTTGIARACAKIGAAVHVAGILEAEHTLALLSERRALAGKRPQVSVMTTYPSYLGELVECGLRLGYGPADFGLRRILTGGEILTGGLRQRCRELFGDVEVGQVYGITELAPFGASLCSEGHLHFEPSGGLVEVQALGEDRPALAGEPGRLVATPFAPYRETSIFLRYDTEDVVNVLPEPPQCELAALPATSQLRGKLALSVRHGEGWTFPRELLEALEELEVVPLPARHGAWPVPGGVGVEVCARSTGPSVRRAIADALEARGIPLRTLVVTDEPSRLERTRPMRCDLKEWAFGVTLPAPEPNSPSTRRPSCAGAAGWG